MYEEKIHTQDFQFNEDDQSSINFKTIYAIFILNWKWFLLSVAVCLSVAFVYLKYKTPIYSATEKILIKDGNGNSVYKRGGLRGLENASNLGIISDNYGLENEIEILKSSYIAEESVRDLKLYVTYHLKGHIKSQLLYKNQPLSVDLDYEHLDKLKAPINIEIEREGDKYNVAGTYYFYKDEITPEGPFEFKKTITSIPATIRTRAGLITITKNGVNPLEDGKTLTVSINSPKAAAYRYMAGITVENTSKTSSILAINMKDENVNRNMDYLKQLIISYNRQANEDKNEVAAKTEEFINDRITKISTELSSTDGELESYKRRNQIMELKLEASSVASKSSAFEQRLSDASTQISLINSLISFAQNPSNRYQVLPSNIGLQDEASTSLINEYNKIALERNRLLRSASENSPVVSELTAQLNDMKSSINQALLQARKNLTIQRDALQSQLNMYMGEKTKTPEQERILTQIGRQQEVKSGLYLMLLEKREENSISLAATADKAKVIEDPQFAGKVSPKNSMIMLIAFIIGLGIPSAILFLINIFKYKIENHEDITKLTKLPIVADIAVASESAKTKADIVVHENRNNQMEEIFRSLRTNLQFMLKEKENVLLFTSFTSGEGKTFTVANLAVSFALLDKKVVLVGLDIRKPRLAELFQINNHKNGITPLLTKDNVEWNDVKSQIVPSGINDNLEILMAGPIPPNPSELLSRPSLEKVIDLLKSNYDYVLIDTAPVGLVSDTLQISKFANVSIYMCRADFTPKTSISLLNDLARENKMTNLCVVLNGIDLSKKKHSYYYGYGAYGKYGRYGGYSKYGSYGGYSKSHYGNENDDSIKQ